MCAHGWRRETHATVDETGWKQADERRWLWAAVTALCTSFLVAKNRSAAVLAMVLGETFDGVVSSDRYKAYLSIPIERRQICWAHLKRNLTAFAERGGEIGDWSTEAVGVVDKIFAAWYRHRDGGSDRTQLQAEMAPLRARMQSLWERGTTLPSWMVRALCKDVRQLEPALWTFVAVEGVEPTNNAAERALRPAVLWRKGCYGADSAAGNAFVAKILTVAATCRQQQKPLLTYLTGSVAAHRSGYPRPLADRGSPISRLATSEGREKAEARIHVDFNPMKQDIWSNEPRVRVNGHGECPDLRDEQRVVVYDDQSAVAAVLEYDPEPDVWWARPTGLRGDLPQSRRDAPLPPGTGTEILCRRIKIVQEPSAPR